MDPESPRRGRRGAKLIPNRGVDLRGMSQVEVIKTMEDPSVVERYATSGVGAAAGGARQAYEEVAQEASDWMVGISRDGCGDEGVFNAIDEEWVRPACLRRRWIVAGRWIVADNGAVFQIPNASAPCFEQVCDDLGGCGIQVAKEAGGEGSGLGVRRAVVRRSDASDPAKSGDPRRLALVGVGSGASGHEAAHAVSNQGHLVDGHGVCIHEFG